jgi:hypothetical protein
LLFAGDVVWLGMLARQLFAYGFPELPMFLVVVSVAGLVGWFLFALGAGLWELSIDAWWALVAFFGLFLGLFGVVALDEAMHMNSDHDVEGALMGTVVILLIAAGPLVYLFRVRRFFNGPLSMNSLANLRS